ncbi:ATP-dependent DNA helicase PIF1 [Holothuria leucospilota]|uniref:ATP-dependent DNA helicase PIF1 n=1 Tax=Holothuria leucospilota TaxID=206669 RepID=A0A9Q1HH85_HOLLE|nr:ATP-dependent DNA helicase PIF1 [Holothuria leucospilota]
MCFDQFTTLRQQTRWTLTKWVRENPHGETIFSELKKGCHYSSRTLSVMLKRLFPSTTFVRRTVNGKRQTLVQGIEIVQKENIMVDQVYNTLTELKEFIPPDIMLMQSDSEEKLTLNITSNLSVNGNNVLKTLKLSTIDWELWVRGCQVNLSKLNIDNTFMASKENLNRVLSIVRKISLCEGFPYVQSMLSENHTYLTEEIQHSEEKPRYVIRSKACKQAISWMSEVKACRSCTGVYTPRKSQQVLLEDDDHEDMSVLLEKCFPHASDEMKILLKAQQDALKAKGPTGRRWNKDVISTCLSLWLRSPRAYEDLGQSGMLVLPSGRHLMRYKNILHQESGPINEMFQWMFQCANDMKIPPDGRAGIVIHDETKIQEDLVVDMTDGRVKLIGWIDSGDEGNDMRILQNGAIENSLATEVLQFYFLGHTGFRFPICHYPTKGVSSAELYIMVWELIAKLQDWGFKVDCVLQDGGSANRKFMKAHFEAHPATSGYIAVNAVNPMESVAMCQDFSHNIKKIRNGLMKSGDLECHTRNLHLNGKAIVWKHWIMATQWNWATNSRSLHHRLTNDHLFPSSTDKMRNHLAEEMLNGDALNLMRSFRSSLPDGSFLNSSIELLENTSRMISVFRDKRPIKTVTDERFEILNDVLEWFQKWRMQAESNEDLTPAERKKRILSQECCDDVEALLMTFPYVCRNHLQKFPHGHIVPSRFNTDIVENHFCQQRGLYNGNTTHPTYASYCSTVNSIILGQSLQSRGRKSNAGLMTAKPLNYYVHKPFSKKRKLLPQDDLVAAIHQLSRGIECSQETIKLMTELKRPLPQNSRPIKLFANNYDVDKCNSDNLMRMKGKMKVYKSVNSGDMQAIKGCVAPDKLFLKVGAPVTLLANIADNLVNGLRGTVKELWEDHVVVKFNGITRETDIHPYNFSIFNPNLGKNIANRKQLPIKLAFALTVHKAQGMTLEEVEVDCRKMTAPGQIGVAIGRAKTKSGLRVLNFYPGQMVRQPQLIEEFYNSSSAPLQDGCFCCTRLQIKPDSRQPSASEVHHANHTQQILHADEAVENDETSIEFLDFFEEAIVLAQGLTLPKNVNPDHYLSDMYFENTYTDEQKLVNDMVPFLKARPVITGTFFKLIYHQMVVLFNECISNENPTGSSFTEFYSKVHKLVGSKLYTDYVKLLFTTSSLSSIHYRIAFGILEKLRGQVVASAALGAKESAVRYVSMIGSKTFKSSPGGDGTIRYIGGWCLGSLRNSKQKRVISNLYDDTNQSVVEKCHNDVLMLDSLMCTEAEARETAEDPLTLNQIERKDSLKGSLCHIHEKTFAFFKTLDKFIRKHETVEHLAIHGKDLYDVIFKNISEDESLTNTWEALFEIKDDASLQKRRASNLLGDVVKKYLKMSAGQFRKEYLRVLKIKKSEAHRKQIKITDSKSVQNTSTHKLSESSKAPTKRGKRTISKEKRKGKGKVKKSTIVQWPCGGCHNECLMDCVCCDSCDIWFHYQCLGLYGDEAELEEEEWFCPQCKSKKAD